MEVATSQLLSSSSSFPSWSHSRSSSSSVLAVYEQSTSVVTSLQATPISRQFPTTAFLRELPGDCKLPTHQLKEDGLPQMLLDRKERKIETVTEDVKYRDSYGFSKDSEEQLLPPPGLWYLLPSLQSLKNVSSSLVLESSIAHTEEQELMDRELRDAVTLAAKALSASKMAVSLAEESKSLDADPDKLSPSSIHSITSSSSGLKEEKIVRSNRIDERRSKRKGSKHKIMVQEIANPIKVNVRKKLSLRTDSNDPIRMFLRSPETRQLLNAEEESELIAQIQELLKLEQVKFRLRSQSKREPTLIEWSEAVGISRSALQSQIHSGIRSREKLIYANFRMVVHLAKQYQGRGLSLQDLLQEGSKGLMRSVEKFKPQAGCRFASYAYWWVRQSIRRALFQHSRTIRLPDSVFTLLGKMLEAKKSCLQDLHRRPTTQELAERTGITTEKLEELLFHARIPVSMQQPIWADQDTTFQEITADNHIETPELSATKDLMRRHMRNLLGVLSPRERKIIRLRYGMDGGRPKTLSDIGSVFGLSKERVRQLENRAIYKLKRCMESQGLEAYTELLI